MFTVTFPPHTRHWLLRAAMLIIGLFAGITQLQAQNNVTRIEYYVDEDPGFGDAMALNIVPGSDLQNLVLPLNTTSLAEGVHRLYARAMDVNGHWSLTNTLLFYKPYGNSGAAPSLHPAPDINRVEYFIDNDPGLGQATPANITPGSNIQDLIIAVNPNSISEGAHRIYVRAMDASGHWSLTNTLLFYKPYGAGPVPVQPPPANITRVEYFIDGDPGFGNATSVPIATGSNIQDVVIAVDPTTIGEGVHRLYVRSLNATGQWSLTNTLLFYRPYNSTGVPPASTPPSIALLEYYFDKDPGYGNGVPVAITASQNISDLLITANISSLTTGNHKLHVRAQDANGRWSMVNTAVFAVQSQAPPFNALTFDGVHDYVSIAARLIQTGNFTVEFWVNYKTLSGSNATFISQGAAGSGFYIGTEAGTTSLRCGDAWPKTGVSIPLNKWVHIALVKEGSKAILYINGQHAADTVNYSIGAGGDSTVLGKQYGSLGEYANMSMDECRIWNVARTPEEISASFNNTLPPAQPGLIAYYNFDQGLPSGNNPGVTTLPNITGDNRYNGILLNFALQVGNNSNWTESYAMVVPVAKPATDITRNSFSANWGLPVIGSIEKYFIDVAKDSLFRSMMINNQNVDTGKSYHVGGLTPGTNYYYRVRGEKATVTGQGGYSQIVKAQTLADVGVPVIKSFSPTTGIPGTTITILGSNFLGVTGVSFGNTPATSFNILNDSTIKAVVGKAATGDLAITGPAGRATAAGFFYPPGNALSFDGVNNYVSIPDHPGLRPSHAITIEAWVKPIDVHTNRYYEIYRREDAGARQQLSFQEYGTMLSFGLQVGSQYTELHVPVNASAFEGRWTHVAATFDGTVKKLYRNGELIGIENIAGLIGTAGASPIMIGSNAGAAEFFNGSIDEIRMWALAKTQQQIRQGMLGPLAGNEPGLKLYLDFDQGKANGNNSTVTTMPNKAPVALTATLNNFALDGAASNWVESYAFVVPLVSDATNVTDSSFTANWAAPQYGKIDQYLLDVARDTAFNNFVPGYEALKVGLQTSYPVKNLSSQSKYYYRVRADRSQMPGQGAFSQLISVRNNNSQPPVISSVSPAIICQNDTIVIQGSNFTNVNAVRVGNTSAASFAFTDSITIKAVFNVATHGIVTVTSPAGTGRFDTVTVKPAITPVFATIPPVVYGSAPPILPTTSQNGIRGTWTPGIVSTTQTGNYIFTPDSGQCAVPVPVRVIVKNDPDLKVKDVNASQDTIGPRDTLRVSWTVANIGQLRAPQKWSERIFMKSLSGTPKLLIGQSDYSNSQVIDPGQNVSRSLQITIPDKFDIGDRGVFAVEIIPDTSVHEAPGSDSNKVASQATPFTVRKSLTISISDRQVVKGSDTGITVTITRTGSLAAAVPLHIGFSRPDRYSVPSSITIPAGRSGTSFTFKAIGNNLLEGTLRDTLRIDATGFAPVSEGFAVLDNNHPSLSLVNMPRQATGGDTVSFQVTTNLAPATPLQVFLSSDNQSRFPVPASVIIPAGAFTANVTVQLPRNNTPELDVNVTVKAVAVNHNSAGGMLLVHDGDVPNLELVIQPKVVAKNAGYFATQATLRRVTKTNSIAFTANLSASIPNTLILPASISLAAGENEKTFDIGVVNNNIADSQRTVTITAAIFVKSCGCTVPPNSAGSVSSDLIIAGNNGPSLQLTVSSLTLRKGSDQAGLLRVTRSTPASSPLTVNLSSSDTSRLLLPLTATIPAGATFVELPIITFDDGVSGGSQRVSLMATANGFSPGTIWVLVTDLNKPDLQITAASVNNNSVNSLASFSYQISIKNSGFATATAGVLVRGYLSKDSVLGNSSTMIIEQVIKQPISQGETIQLPNAVNAPGLPGKYYLLFKVNPTGSLPELLLTNNTSSPIPFSINPAYTVTAKVDHPYYTRGAAIAITGNAIKNDGTPASLAKVEVDVITNGIRRKMMAVTNALGQYTASFVPVTNEAGHYVVGAGFPDIEAVDEKDSFDILGVRINGNNIPQLAVTINDTLKGTLSLENLGKTPLTNFRLAPVILPNGARVSFDTIPLLRGNAIINIHYRISGSALTKGRTYEVAELQAVADEGQVQKAYFYYFCQAPNAYLESDVKKINVVTSRLSEKLFELKLFNRGRAATGNIAISLPQISWLSSLTPLPLQSLAPGDSATVTLKFFPDAAVPFNFPINGNIGIRAQTGNAFTVPFSFEKRAESAGAVKINVTDQFTYYTTGGPQVAGAHVVIKNYFTGAVYADGMTDAKGVFVAGNVPEGKHRIVVEKEKHNAYNSTITINPGDTTTETAFLNYQAITFSWTVVPTAIQDKYDITLTAKFETHVPKPVVIIEMPKKLPKLSGNEQYAFNLTLTNYGLISAEHVALYLPTDPEYEFITNYEPGDLPAEQSIQVPVIMQRKGAHTSQASRATGSATTIGQVSQFLGIQAPAAAAATPGCTGFVEISFIYKCNFSTGLWETAAFQYSYDRDCSSGGSGTGPSSGQGEFPYNGNGVYFFPPSFCPFCEGPAGGNAEQPTYVSKKKSCVKCIIDMAAALLGCEGIDIPSELLCYIGVRLEKQGAVDYFKCLTEKKLEEKQEKNFTILEWKMGIPRIIRKRLLCLKNIAEAAEKCSQTNVAPGISGKLTNLPVATGKATATGTAGVVASTGSSSGIFEQTTSRLKAVVTAFNIQREWGVELFGKVAETDGWVAFYPLIQPYVHNLMTIPPTVQDSIISAMNGYDTKAGDVQAFFIRWNTSIEARNNNILSPNAQYPNIIDWQKVSSWSDSLVDIHNYALDNGYKSIADMHAGSLKTLHQIVDNQKNAVCASVTVQFSQKLAMTREAFEGTLEIFNGHPTDAMDSLSVNIQIKDASGTPSNHLFEIQTTSLKNLSDVSGKGAINAQQTALVKFLFIPGIGAAPVVPREYSFGGTVRYWDPYAKAIVTLPLAAVKLTVNPSPNLVLQYFMQRNILGRDPLTNIIQPSVPAELAVMIENHGYGPAVNLTISSAQPKIVDNEKGLAINFKLIGSNFQGRPKNLGITDINFGTIPALESRVGQWYFTSSLLGKFVSYDAKVVHNNSFGNPDLSLIKEVKLHELTKSIREYGSLDDGIHDFLVNDLFDVDDTPDMIYFSQGNRKEKVASAASGSFSSPVQGPSFTNSLRVTATDTGWNFIRLNDPANGAFEIVSVIRSDGQVIPLDNVWLTFVTLPISQPPVYENKFNFVDKFPAPGVATYTVAWKPRNLDVPGIVRFEGTPGSVTSEQVRHLRVIFNKPINPSTFTYRNMTLTFQGGPDIMDSSVIVTRIDSVTFNIDLTSLTTGNGFYSLIVQAAEIEDIYGIKGVSGKQAVWSQFLTVPTVQAYRQIPASRFASYFDTIAVQFNLPIDSSTVTPARFMVRKDSVTLPGTVKIDSIHSNRKLYYLSGLKDIITKPGRYYFVVDLPNIKSTRGANGMRRDSVVLTLDNTGPRLMLFNRTDSGALDAQHTAYVKLGFDKEIFDFNVSALKLTRNGEFIPLAIDQLSNTDLRNWVAGNFSLLTYPEGDYALTIDLTKIKDAAANKGVGQQVLGWTVNRSSLISITNLKLYPDLGYSDSDLISSGDSLDVRFMLSGRASKVDVLQADKGGEQILRSLDSVEPGAIVVPVRLFRAGDFRIKVRATDSFGHEITAEQAFYTDPVALTAAWQFNAGQKITKQPDSIPVVFSARLLNDATIKDALRFTHDGVTLPVTHLGIQRVNDTLYNIYGMNAVSASAGNYAFDMNTSVLKKYSSGKTGSGFISTSWTVAKLNQPPVAKAGSDIMVLQPGVVTLNGTASFHPDGDSITYHWISPPGVQLRDTNSATPSFDVTALDNGSNYSFLLVVSDGTLFSTDVVNVKVRLDTTDDAEMTFWGLDSTFCELADIVILTGTPSGGVFSGDGIIDDAFYPALAGAGMHTITYSVDGRSVTQTTTVSPAFSYYRDADGDGYGYGGDVIRSCDSIPPDGYVGESGDCDDGDPNIHPGAVETGNGIDDNCNGLIDESLPAASSTAKGANTVIAEAIKKEKLVTPFDIQVSPVPSVNTFRVTFKGSESDAKVAIRVFDATGRLIEVWGTSVGRTLFLGDTYAKGFYWMEASCGKERKIVKLIKL